MELKNIVVLIDADNADPKMVKKILETLSLKGEITTKRVYGNFKKPQLKPWEDVCKEFAIHPIQQFDYVKGKNATDLAVAIDAMNLLHSNRYDAFAIVSSDSDFTPLLIELREHGMRTFGFGNSNATDSFKNACVTFFNADDWKKVKTENKKEALDANELDKLLFKACDDYKGDDGFALLSVAGDYIKRVRSDFNIKNYQFRSLSEYVKAKPQLFETKSKSNLIWFKCKQ